MRIVVVASLLVLSACEPASPPEPKAPDYTAARAAAAAQQAEVDAKVASIQAAAEKEQERRAAEEGTTRGVAEMKRDQEAEAARDAAEKAAAREAERKRSDAQCAATLDERGASAREDALAWVSFLRRTTEHIKTIRRVCTPTNSTGVRVETEKDGRGTIYRVRDVGRVDDVKCGSLPHGVTLDDARFVIYGLNADTINGPVVDSAPRGTNDPCREIDRAAGLDTSVLRSDTAGIVKLAKWKRPAQ